MFLTYNHPTAVKAFLKGLAVRCDFEGLKKITETFLKYPYENFTKIIRANTAKSSNEHYRLPEIVWQEHEEFGTGGTCFSLTYFFETILKNVGFDCYPIMVDRSYGKNTHCALIVILDGRKFLVDPGYCISRPIEVTEKETVYQFPHNTYILSPAKNGAYQVSTSRLGVKKTRYLLKDMPVSKDEFLKFWNDSFSWPMMRHLCVTRLSEDGYLYLYDKFLRSTTVSGKKQENIKSSYDKRITEAFHISPKIVKLALDIIM